METKTENSKNKILDAEAKNLGRIASEAARLLMGKDSITFTRNKKPEKRVEIINASKLNLEEKKLNSKVYKRFSGYPGGLKEETMEHLISRKGYPEIIKKAVYGMLPKNKLRAEMMKNLIIKE